MPSDPTDAGIGSPLHGTHPREFTSRTEDPADTVDGLEGKVGEVERKTIVEALEKHGWNIQRTAETLSMNRIPLSRRIKKHNIQLPK